MRFAIFGENYKKIVQFNAAHEDAKFALNKFADLTSTEFKSIYASGYKKNNNIQVLETVDFAEVGALPDRFDWRDKGMISGVKDQGQCGSCWAIATVSALETFYWINHSALFPFSVQQIIDCDQDSHGCDGGDPIEALSYTALNGLELDVTYPYTGQDGICTIKKFAEFATNKGSKLVTSKDTSALKTALVQQPVSVAIEADEDVFQFYSSGVIGNGCGDSLDHLFSSSVMTLSITTKHLLL